MTIKVQGQDFQEIDTDALSAQEAHDLSDLAYEVYDTSRPKPAIARRRLEDTQELWDEFRSWFTALRAR